MTLTLFQHPLASFCHKVLIAFYENELAFRPITVDLLDPGPASALLARWPLGKLPVLYDAERGRTVPGMSLLPARPNASMVHCKVSVNFQSYPIPYVR